MDQKSKPILFALIAVILAVAGYFYFFKSVPKGSIGAAGEVSKQVPEIATNPANKVPEVNPLDRANPFKYNNPLR